MKIKETFEYEMHPIEVAKWINSHEIEERMQVFANIDLRYDKKEQLKKLFTMISNDLIKSDLINSELLTLLSAVEKLSYKIKNEENYVRKL